MKAGSPSQRTNGAERASKSQSKSPADAATSNGAATKPGKGSNAKRNPARAQLHLSIPAELRALDQWVVSDPKGRPINARTGGGAMCNNPQTWSNFDAAIAACEKRGPGYLPALALTAEAGFTVIDLDDKAAKPATPDDLAQFDRIIADCYSYTERSRSGRGYHIVVKGSLPAPVKTTRVEMYDRDHFMTFTGDVVSAQPIRKRPALLAKLAASLAPAKAKANGSTPARTVADRAAPSDRIVIKRATESGGDAFRALHRGDWETLELGDGSQSEADFAYLSMLWDASGNRAQVLRLFEDSPLFRDDTDDKPKDAGYPARTLEAVIGRHASKPAKPDKKQKPSGDASDPGGLRLIRGSDVKLESVEWVWGGFIVRGKLQILAGAPGTGKTTVALSIAAAITSGSKLPDGQQPQVGNVVIWSGEDGIADTLAPRLQAAGADMERIFFVGDIGEGADRRAFDPALDMYELEAVCQQIGNIQLVIVDSVVSAIAGDGHKNNEVRRGLGPLVELGDTTGAAVLGISHFSKNTTGRNVLERVTGSLAFGALARVVLATARADDGRCVLVRDKSNLGPSGDGFRYTIELTDQFYNGRNNVVSRIAWGEAVQGSPNELLERIEAKRSAREEAAEWLGDLLADGPVDAVEVVTKAQAANITDATLRRAAEALLVVKARVSVKGGKRGEARYQWSLPKVIGSTSATQRAQSKKLQ